MQDNAQLISSLLSQYENIILQQLKLEIDNKINAKFLEIDSLVAEKISNIEKDLLKKHESFSEYLTTKTDQIDLKQKEIYDIVNKKLDDFTKSIAEVHNVNTTMQRESQKLESLRIAQTILTDNARSLPVESRKITAEDVNQFANTLNNYIISN